MEIDWRFLATKSAYLPTYKTKEYILNIIPIYFRGEFRMYQSPSGLSEKAQLIFNFIVNVSKTIGLVDDKKVALIKRFLLDVSPGSTEDINQIFSEAGYSDQSTNYRKDVLLNGKSFHKQIITHSKPYVEKGDYFHAVIEACKAFNKEVQRISSSREDGVKLMFQAFGKNGKLAFNSNITESEQNENDGFMHLSAGIMFAFRNPGSHETAINTQLFWNINDIDECMEVLAFISFMFKKLENATLNPVKTGKV
jgi:uncharacterized protein (TIGR02391 family)